MLLKEAKISSQLEDHPQAIRLLEEATQASYGGVLGLTKLSILTTLSLAQKILNQTKKICKDDDPYILTQEEYNLASRQRLRDLKGDSSYDLRQRLLTEQSNGSFGSFVHKSNSNIFAKPSNNSSFSNNLSNHSVLALTSSRPSHSTSNFLIKSSFNKPMQALKDKHYSELRSKLMTEISKQDATTYEDLHCIVPILLHLRVKIDQYFPSRKLNLKSQIDKLSKLLSSEILSSEADISFLHSRIDQQSSTMAQSM